MAPFYSLFKKNTDKKILNKLYLNMNCTEKKTLTKFINKSSLELWVLFKF